MTFGFQCRLHHTTAPAQPILPELDGVDIKEYCVDAMSVRVLSPNQTIVTLPLATHLMDEQAQREGQARVHVQATIEAISDKAMRMFAKAVHVPLCKLAVRRDTHQHQHGRNTADSSSTSVVITGEELSDDDCRWRQEPVCRVLWSACNGADLRQQPLLQGCIVYTGLYKNSVAVTVPVFLIA